MADTDDTFNLIAFGDQAVPYYNELHRLATKKDNRTVDGFLADAYRLLRAEISGVSPSERAAYPKFTTLTELIDAHHASQTPNCALDGALVCIHQIACFLSYYTTAHAAYPSAPSSCLIGSCTGLFAAAAVSCSRDVVDLVSFGAKIVAVAFRVGLLVQSKTAAVSGADSTTASSYSSVVSGIDREAASRLIEEYRSAESLPALASPYVSAVGHGGVTVSGPPAQIQGFLRHNPTLRASKVAVSGLFHSPLLYTGVTIDHLVSSLDEADQQRPMRLSILSNADGQKRSTGICGSLLKEAIWEIVSKQLRWDLVLDNACLTLASSAASEAVVLPFASTGAQSIVAAAGRQGRAGDKKPIKIVDTAPRFLNSENAGAKRGGASANGGKCKIAIIGFSGRFPEAEDNEAFWQLLAAGLDVHKEIPKDRFDPWLYYDATGKKKNSSKVTKGCFVKHPDLFDSRFFGMSARESEQADPAQRLALMTAYEAMEMAGFVPDSTPSTQRERVGVFYGTASDDYREINAAQNIDTYFVPGGSRAFLPARINYHFRFSGPSFDVDTACSSGLAAIHIACNSLWAGDCDVAIAGGTNILTNPDNWAGLDKAHFLSHTGNCQTFDDGADGYCRAESVATVILKRLEDAELDMDPIFGTILGAYTNHSAEAVSMTRPHSGAQRSIFSRILNTAGVDGGEVSYVEMHGTGTQHGDACEMDSVLSVFAPEGSHRPQSLYLGSAKANIGHGESASGVSSLIKVLMMMEKESIPRHVGIKTRINRNFPTDLPQRNVHIAMQTTPWTRPDPREKPFGRRAFVNNFGAAGGNSSVLLEDAPLIKPTVAGGDDPRPLHIVAVSAKTQTSLKRNIRSLLEHLDANPDLSAGSLSFTTTARRTHYGFRAAVIGRTIDEIRSGLKAEAANEQFVTSTAGKEPSVCFCFTGQGSQYLGMGRKLLAIPQFKALLAGLEDVVRLQGFAPIMPIIDGTCTTTSIDLVSPITLQLAIACLEMALGKFWKSLGIAPQMVIGHSLGEYAAMNTAGILSDADTVHLVGTRATLLEKHCSVGTHSMLAIKAPLSKVASLLEARPSLEVTCINGPEDTVVGGSDDEIEAFSNTLTRLSVRATRVKVQFAFHSGQVEPMLEEFRRSCRAVSFKEPLVALVSPLLGKTITSAVDLGTPAEYLSRHCREAVNFCGALQSASQAGSITDSTVWLEIGPHPICAGMLKATLGSSIKHLPSLRRGEDDWSVFVPTITALYRAGLPIQWNEYHSGFKDNLRVLRLPAYQWELKSYWIPYAHDWCLSKGSAPAVCNHDQLALVPAPAPVTPARVKQFLTTSVQDLIEENYFSDESWITARTDLQHPDLKPVLLGHRVNGRPVCSSAVYADMAATLFTRLLEKSPVPFAKTDLGVEVSDMTADKSLVLNEEAEQLLELKARVNWQTRVATFTMSSITSDGKPIAHHCKCTGAFSARSNWAAEWRRREFLVRSRIDDLHQSVHDDSDAVNLVKTGMFYKLFSALVEYSPSFKGCRELIMRSAGLESTAKVRFNTPDGEGDKWLMPPYWLDSLGQITGFTMNANDAVDSRAQVFINHGWENMRILEPLSQDKTYQTWLKMEKKDEGQYIGDVYILSTDSDSGRIVAMYEGVTFSAVQRKILDLVLPPGNKAATAPKPPAFKVQEVVSAPTPAVAAFAPAPAPAPAPVAAQRAVMPQAPIMAPETSAVQPPAFLRAGDDVLVADRLRTIVAEEVGAPIDEVQDAVDLADLGVDSLLALTMADRILEELGVKVDSANFIAGLTVKDLVQMVVGTPTPASDSSSADSPPRIAALVDSQSGTETPLSSLSLSSPSNSDSDEKPSLAEATLPSPDAFKRALPPLRATSSLLQGNPATATKTLWLFPDGAGVATSYLQLPDIEPDSVAVYGLSSPFIKRAADMPHYDFDDLATAYLAELRRRHPCGSECWVGGWSAGGICAYRAAQRLVEDGSSDIEIAGLVLLDAPNPIGLEKLPVRLYDAFEELGLFAPAAGRKPPAWLLPHMSGFLGILDTYEPRAWSGKAQPLATCVLWAREGVDEAGAVEIRADDPPNMRWLLRRRGDVDLRFNGWDGLVGGGNIKVEVMEGVHHFSMLTAEGVDRVSGFVRKALGLTKRF